MITDLLSVLNTGGQRYGSPVQTNGRMIMQWILKLHHRVTSLLHVLKKTVKIMAKKTVCWAFNIGDFEVSHITVSSTFGCLKLNAPDLPWMHRIEVKRKVWTLSFTKTQIVNLTFHHFRVQYTAPPCRTSKVSVLTSTLPNSVRFLAGTFCGVRPSWSMFLTSSLINIVLAGFWTSLDSVHASFSVIISQQAPNVYEVKNFVWTIDGNLTMASITQALKTGEIAQDKVILYSLLTRLEGIFELETNKNTSGMVVFDGPGCKSTQLFWLCPKYNNFGSHCNTSTTQHQAYVVLYIHDTPNVQKYFLSFQTNRRNLKKVDVHKGINTRINIGSVNMNTSSASYYLVNTGLNYRIQLNIITLVYQGYNIDDCKYGGFFVIEGVDQDDHFKRIKAAYCGQVSDFYSRLLYVNFTSAENTLLFVFLTYNAYSTGYIELELSATSCLSESLDICSHYGYQLVALRDINLHYTSQWTMQPFHVEENLKYQRMIKMQFCVNIFQWPVIYHRYLLDYSIINNAKQYMLGEFRGLLDTCFVPMYAYGKQLDIKIDRRYSPVSRTINKNGQDASCKMTAPFLVFPTLITEGYALFYSTNRGFKNGNTKWQRSFNFAEESYRSEALHVSFYQNITPVGLLQRNCLGNEKIMMVTLNAAHLAFEQQLDLPIQAFTVDKRWYYSDMFVLEPHYGTVVFTIQISGMHSIITLYLYNYPSCPAKCMWADMDVECRTLSSKGFEANFQYQWNRDEVFTPNIIWPVTPLKVIKYIGDGVMPDIKQVRIRMRYPPITSCNAYSDCSARVVFIGERIKTLPQHCAQGVNILASYKQGDECYFIPYTNPNIMLSSVEAEMKCGHMSGLAYFPDMAIYNRVITHLLNQLWGRFPILQGEYLGLRSNPKVRFVQHKQPIMGIRHDLVPSTQGVFINV